MSGILLPTSLRTKAIVNPVILDISPLTSFILALNAVVVTKLFILSYLSKYFIFNVFDLSLIIYFFNKPANVNAINFCN